MQLLTDEQVARVGRFIAMTDLIGMPRISLEEWATDQKSLPRKLKEFSERNCSRSGEQLVLRGRTYYAGYRLLNAKNREEIAETRRKILQDILASYEANEELIEEVRQVKGLDEPSHEPHIYSLLELQKQISLSLLKCYYRSMFKEKQSAKDYFDQLLELCGGTINRHYRFIIEGKISDRKDLPEAAKDTGFPPMDTEDFWRELDDPIKIALYSLNAAQGITQPYELIINPFSGGIEIGFAFKAIGDAIGRDLVEDILLLNYSKYRQGHTLESTEEDGRTRLLLEIGFPAEIREDAYLRLCGQESCVVDDNTTTGSTLRELRDALVNSHICERADIGAVELGRIDRLKRFDENIISELVFEPIGDRMSEAKKREIILKTILS